MLNLSHQYEGTHLNIHTSDMISGGPSGGIPSNHPHHPPRYIYRGLEESGGIPSNYPHHPVEDPNLTSFARGFALYQPEIMDAMKDEKCHILEKFIEVKPLVSIIEGYDTPSFVSYWSINQDYSRFSLPLIPEGEYDFRVEWGDGMYDRITNHDQPETTHLYDLGDQGGKRFMVTLTGLLNGLSHMRGCDGISQWGCARIVVPRKPPHKPRLKTKARERLEKRRRKYHEQQLRADIHSHLATMQLEHEARDSYFRPVFESFSDRDLDIPDPDSDEYPDPDSEEERHMDYYLDDLERQQYNRLLEMFFKWQPLGAEFKTNITCDKEYLVEIEHDCNRKIVYYINRYRET